MSTDHNFDLSGNKDGTSGIAGSAQTGVPTQATTGDKGGSHDWPKGNDNGGTGHVGTQGYVGQKGGDGGNGDTSGNGVFYVVDLFGKVTVSCFGKGGGNGGNGGTGGTGGQGGNGGSTGSGTGQSGDQGDGGAGGKGGSGGAGGNGGNGGNGGVVALYASNVTSGSFTGQANGGRRGSAGIGGNGGTGGAGGTGNSDGDGGSAGDKGANGTDGVNGTDGSITVKKAEPITFSSIAPTTGPASGGVAVTILGGNFIGNKDGWILSSVKIGTMPVSNLTWVSQNELTGIVPAMPAGEYDVTGANPDGSMAVMLTPFTYT